MHRNNPTDAKRIRLAKQAGRVLVRQMSDMDKLSADEVAALADAMAALMAKYPDVYPKPPVSIELIRVHAQELRDAEEAVRQEEAEALRARAAKPG